MKICFASHNQHKIEELNQMLSGEHEVVGLDELGITDDIPETGETFEENAAIKARYVYDLFKIPVFADDSGLCVDPLDGEPGVYSARYAGIDKDAEKNMDLLLNKLQEHEDRNAKFVSVIVYINENGDQVDFYGEVKGVIRHERSGTNGFGYDPIFQPQGYDQTFAEITPEVKNRISHRAIAVNKLVKHLKNNG